MYIKTAISLAKDEINNGFLKWYPYFDIKNSTKCQNSNTQKTEKLKYSKSWPSINLLIKAQVRNYNTFKSLMDLTA